MTTYMKFNFVQHDELHK